MKLAAMQPYFLPYLGYFQLIRSVDRFIIYDRVDYIRHGWINRNRYLPVNGEPRYFIVPIRGKQSGARICDITIDNREPWQFRLQRLIEMNYRRSPFFSEIFPLIESILNRSQDQISTLNSETLRMICAYLEIETELLVSGDEFEDLESDLGFTGEMLPEYVKPDSASGNLRTLRILDICKLQGANIYVNAIGGRSLYDKKTFEQNGIHLLFVHSHPYIYRQNAARFFPDLSILDVLMNCGKQQTQKLLNNYELI